MADSNELIFEIKFDIQKMEQEIASIKSKFNSLGKDGKTAFDSMGRSAQTTYNVVSLTRKEIEAQKKAIKSAIDTTKTEVSEMESKLGKNNQRIEELSKKVDMLRTSFNNGEFDVWGHMYQDMVKAEAQLKTLTDEQNKLNQSIPEARSNIAELEAEYSKLESSVPNNLKEIIARMKELQMAGQGNTEEYRNLEQAAASLKNQQSLLKKEIGAIARESSGLGARIDVAAGSMQLLAGSYSTVVGLTSAFADSNEEAAEMQTKLQSAIAVSTGVQGVYNALQSKSNLMVGISIIQKKAEAKAIALKSKAELSGTAATKAATVAQKIFNAVAKANPYVLLAMALVTVVGALTAFSLVTSEAKKQQEAMNGELQKMANESLSKTIVQVDSLALGWNKLGDDMEAKKKFIDDNKQAFDELGVKITDVADAENLLVKNKEKFIQAQKMKALASAARAKAEEVLKEILDKQIDKEEARQRMVSGENNNPINAALPGAGIIQGYNQLKDAYTYIHTDSETEILNNTYDKLLKVEEYLNEQFKKAMNDAGVTSTETADEVAKYTKKWYEQELSKARDAYSNLTEGELSSAHAQNLKRQIQNYEDIIKKWDTSRKNSSKGIDEYLKTLDDMGKKYSEAFTLMSSSDEQTAESGKKMYAELQESGENYLDYLKKQRAELDKDGDGVADSGKSLDQSHVDEITKRIADEQNKYDNVLRKQEEDIRKNSEDRMSFLKGLSDNESKETAKTLEERINNMKKNLEEARDKEIAELQDNYKKIDDEWVRLMTESYKKKNILATQSEVDAYIKSQRGEGDDRRLTPTEMNEKITKDKNADTQREIAKQEALIWDEQLKKYKSYADKYVQLTEEKNDKIAKLEKNGVKQSVIDAINEDYDKQVNALNEQFDEEQIAELADNLDSLIGASLENMISLANDLGERLKVAIKKGDAERAMKLETALHAVNEEIANTQEETKEDTPVSEKIFGKTTDETIGKIKEMTDAVASLAGAFGDMKDSEKIAMETSLQMFSDGLNIIQNAAQGDYVRALASAIGMVTNLISNTSKWSDAMFTEHIDALEKKGNEAVDKIADMIERLSNVRDNSVGLTAVAYSNFIERKFNEEIEALNKEKEELKELLKGNLTTEQREQLEGEIAEIDERILETQKKITDEQERRMEMLTGYSTSSDAVTAFGNAIIKAWENGTSAANEAMGTWEDMLKNFAKQKFLSDFSKQFEGIFNDYYKQITGDGLSEADQVEFQNKITALAERGEQFYANLMESMGIANDIALEGTKGSGIAKASQESIDELNGRFLSVQMFTASISGSVERLYQNSTSIMRDVSDIRGFQENISGKIDAMNGYMQDIVNNGIRMN